MKIIFGSFFLIGAICLGITSLLYSNNAQFERDALQVKGTVTKNIRSRSMSYPQVTFKDQSGKVKTFKSRYGQRPAQYEVGEEVIVLYPINRPEKAKIKPFSNFGLAGIITGSIGSIFFLIGSFVLFTIYRRQYHQWWAKKYGQKISAKITKIRQDKSYHENGKSPWVIEAKWRSPKINKVFYFKSDYYWIDPNQVAKENQEVIIFIDPRNPTRYFMQEFLI